MRIHDDILREIANRAQGATPGPYFVTPHAICSESQPRSGRGPDNGYAGTLIAESMRDADRDFLVCCRPETIASMVLELQTTRLKLAHFRAVVGDTTRDLNQATKQLLEDDEEIPF